MTRLILKILPIPVRQDLYRYMGDENDVLFFKALFIPAFRYLFFYRQICKAKKYSFKWLALYLFYRHYMYKFGFQIPITRNIGAGLFLGHFGPIVINPSAIIGDNCNIAQNVTIGRVYRGVLNGSPNISNKVWIGAGAVIVGKITIGTNVLIAPNAFVNFNVPENSIVIGNPGKVIPKANATEGYINNTI